METYQYKVLSSALWVREAPDIESNKIGIVYKNDILYCTKIQGNWVYHTKGWSKIQDMEGIHLIDVTDKKTVTKIISVNQSRENVIGSGTGSNLPITINVDEKDSYIVDESNSTPYGGIETAGYFIKDVRGIHGMPYQFMESVDTRADSSYKFGRKYAEKIITKMPLLLITPGKPRFMKDFNDESKRNIVNYAKRNGIDATMNSLLGESEQGKLYSFETCYKDYYSFVNPMCQRMARYLGIHEKRIDSNSKVFGSYEWENYTNTAFRNFISSKENIAFYIDSDTQISESFSNSTGESMLTQGFADNLSNIGRELQFLMGAGAGIEFDALDSDDVLENFEKWSNKYASFLPGRLISNLKQGFKSVVNGGKMIFPEIWNDSSFSRSYRVSIKLRTPDADVLSWYMNIGVPMLHLICLVAPHQLGANGFQSPFLVRGWYKGFFNCDMGIITDMDISKGDKGKWTLDGLPTEVDISFTMKDLYQILTITSDKKISDLLANTALLDYIANMCGINVSKPDLERAIDLAYMTVKNRVVDIITFDGFIGVENALSNMINSIFKR